MIDTIITETARREFSRAMRFDDKTAAVLPRSDGKRDRLLYLHVPFCESLCPYCSFNRMVFEEALCRRYFTALRREIRLYRDLGYDFSGIYVGGGTPTILIDELEATLDLCREVFSIREVSVETNPNHLHDGNIAVLQRAGVNRLSVGVQSFDDDLLKAMGRYHKYGSGESIAGRLTDIRNEFDTLNADMIFNFPLQTEAVLTADLARLLDTGVGQITYYPLMVSDSTRKSVEMTLGKVDYRREKKYYYLITDVLSGAYRFSSAWCFSRKESMVDEYIVDYDEYAGLGSGSIGYIGGMCYANTFSVPDYIDLLDGGVFPLMASRTFTLKERIRYDFVMKLFGLALDLTQVRQKYGTALAPFLWPDILAFALAGALRYEGGTLRLTGRGRYYWVIMMREFFTAVNNFRDYCRLGGLGSDYGQHG